MSRGSRQSLVLDVVLTFLWFVMMYAVLTYPPYDGQAPRAVHAQ